MPNQNNISLDELMKRPDVQSVISNSNREMDERREYQPPQCDVFLWPYTILRDYPNIKFDIDREAETKLPKIINNCVQAIVGSDDPDEEFKSQYRKKRNIGVVFSGGPAPGGHNVIAGIFDAAKKANPDTKIFGFLEGPDGVIENNAVELNNRLVHKYRNTGGFTLIKTGRSKIDTKEKMTLSRETCQKLGIDALVIVGGDDSNTNAAFLAEEMYEDGVQVIGVPKTIDGDIQVKDNTGNTLCAVSFGFHTAARAFANSISNLCIDSSSDIKYWHICKVMGRVASHLALEVALQTHANMTIIGEDLANYVDRHRIEKADKLNTVDYTAYGMTLRHLSRVICDGIVRRAAVGKNYGVLVIPEGVLEFINEIQVFIIKLNTIIAEYNKMHDNDFHSTFSSLEDKLDYLRRLGRQFREDNEFHIWNTRDDDLFNDLPAFFQEGLLTERDSHGNFQFSQVETDKVIMALVSDYLKILKDRGLYKIGISRAFYEKTVEKEGYDPDLYGPLLFKNYDNAEYLIVKESIMSLKTLRQILVKHGAISNKDNLPAPIKKVYEKSVPKFKTQTHFFGYDGRGSAPTSFDCNYTYNLGLTVFSLIANNATGQMAAIRNLEHDFSKWEPIGVPIAPLMRLEERKGKLALVLEKSIVDIETPAYQLVEASREKWLAARSGDDNYRRPGPIRFTGKSVEEMPIILKLNALSKKIKIKA